MTLVTYVYAVSSLSLSLCSDSVFEFDHIHSSSLLGTRPLAVLYAQLGTQEFEQFHDVLVSLSNSGRLVYVLRHYIKVCSICLPPFPFKLGDSLCVFLARHVNRATLFVCIFNEAGKPGN